jgi:anti-sigma regulatory factor (Ser/Thr protein kinase)
LPPDRARIRRWFGPPRRLLLALATVTVASAGSLSWVGWEMLRQDDAVQAQREQERLEHQADLAVQTLERLLAGTEERLADWAIRPSAPVPDPEHGGLIVTFTPTTVEPSPASRLLFYPSLPARPEPAAHLFAAGETAEFQQRDHRRAALIFRDLARSPDRAVRAAALMRLGRTLRASARHVESLAVYTEMAALGDVPVAGLPADLVARAARMQVLVTIGRDDEARREARALDEDLANSRWKLTAGQYEHYADAATAAAGGDAVAGGENEDVAVARAAAGLWADWRENLPPSGRRSVQTAGTPLLAVWRSAPERIALWIVRPGQLLEQVSADPQIAIALSDAEGVTVAGALEGSGRNAIRVPTNTRLPWAVHARVALGAAPPTGLTGLTSGLTRGRLIVLGLGLMLMFLVAGVYFIGRAVRQEMDLARLQSDFVSAVSHEFRTPLAAMRQLSELLAAGRVPHEGRRQQYYESLASESRRLQRLVENLLNFGRLQAGGRPYRLEPLDSRTLVEQVVAEFRSQLSRPDCEIDVSGDTEPVRILADADGVSLALHSLLDNAVKYGGASHSVSVSWTKQGSRVALRVRDQGPGIAVDEQTRIFQRFVRGAAAAAANVRGTGIGLAMVQQVVTGHGGEVTVESAPGAGSVFTMWLPAEPGA